MDDFLVLFFPKPVAFQNPDILCLDISNKKKINNETFKALNESKVIFSL